MAGHWRDDLRAAPTLLASMLLSTAGFGLVLPFLFIYLTKVRGLDPTWVGVAGAWIGLAGLLAAGPAGALVDRYGSRPVYVAVAVLQGVGLGGYAFVHSVWQAFAAATLAAMGGPPLIGAFDTLLASATTEAGRQRFFGLSFVVLNLGIGLGGLIGGAVADVHHPSSFQVLYLCAGGSVVAGGVVVVGLRSLGSALPVVPDAPPHGGWRAVLADRVFVRLVAVGVLLMGCAYGQLEYGFTAFSADVAKVSTRVVGWAFAANCTTIVVIQLGVLPRLEGRSRSRLLALASALLGGSWLVLALAAHRPASSLAIIAVVGCALVFALGEVVMSPIMPALTNSLAPDELRGRYNTLSSMTFGVSGVIGPLSAAPLIGNGLWGVWLALVVGAGGGACAGALTLRRRLTARQDGRESPGARETIKA
ncbi:MAG TPA: MFS transporter [Mycobacteriales bacterium]|nr:MFS transporter [Mycobacteriales bacterium]